MTRKIGRMVSRWASRIRALLALVLFATSDGGTQMLDAVVFHSHPVRDEQVGINADDHCHGERCELGLPITSPPPIAPPDVANRFESPFRRAVVVAPLDAPRTSLATAPLGPRAPPPQS